MTCIGFICTYSTFYYVFSFGFFQIMLLRWPAKLLTFISPQVRGGGPQSLAGRKGGDPIQTTGQTPFTAPTISICNLCRTEKRTVGVVLVLWAVVLFSCLPLLPAHGTKSNVSPSFFLMTAFNLLAYCVRFRHKNSDS
jgi:hypothetical protein